MNPFYAEEEGIRGSILFEGIRDDRSKGTQETEKIRQGLTVADSPDSSLSSSSNLKSELAEWEAEKRSKPAKRPVRWSLDNLPLTHEHLVNPHEHLLDNHEHLIANSHEQLNNKREESGKQYTTTPFRFVKPNQAAFHSTGYLSKKEKGRIMPTPKTPSKRAHTKFVVGSTPFLLSHASSHTNIDTPFSSKAFKPESQPKIEIDELNSNSSLENDNSIHQNGNHLTSTPDPPSKEIKLGFGWSPPRNVFIQSSSPGSPTTAAVQFKCPGSLISDDEEETETNRNEISGLSSCLVDMDIEETEILSGSFSSGYFHLPKWKTERARFLGPEYFLHENDGDYSVKGDYFEENFVIVGQLGHGSFAQVYKIKRKQDGRLFALKRTIDSFTGMADRAKKLKEVESLWKIKGSQNCIEIHEAWEQYGYLYIVTELCEDGDLKNLIEKISAEGKFPEDQVLEIVGQICLGLRDIHRKGLMHLDIKPENVLIARKEKEFLFKIADYGLSRTIDLFAETDTEGDKLYMAPEVLENVYSQKADVFSVGLIMLEMLADIELPEQGELWQNLRNEEFEMLSFDCRKQVIDLMIGMLKSNPKERLDIEQVLERLNNL